MAECGRLGPKNVMSAGNKAVVTLPDLPGV